MIMASLIFYTLKNGISPMPTSEKVKRALLEALPELEDGIVVDLGSGWGNLIFPLAIKYPSCQIFGYENSLIPYWFSLLIKHQKNLKIHQKNFYDISLDNVDLLICYLFPKGMEKLKEKLNKELKVGAHIASHTFAIPGWQPQKVIEVNDFYRSKIYLYKI